MDVKELRTAERYQVVEPLAGSFGSASVTILDIALAGVQIEHAQPLRIGTRARLWFKRGDIAVSTQATVVWSHLSKRPNDSGKLLYHSGVLIEEPSEFALVLQSLADRGVIRRDPESLERKRARILARQQEKLGKPTVRVLRPESEVPHEQALLIQHARKRLRENPDEAAKWYNRAKFAVTAEGAIAAETVRHRHDVLAVWEYLERSVELSVIVRVFDRG